jgi:hypothetical protein
MNPPTDDDRCPDCTWKGDHVATQCVGCKEACEAMIDFLVAKRTTSAQSTGEK